MNHICRIENCKANQYFCFFLNIQDLNTQPFWLLWCCLGNFHSTVFSSYYTLGIPLFIVDGDIYLLMYLSFSLLLFLRLISCCSCLSGVSENTNTYLLEFCITNFFWWQKSIRFYILGNAVILSHLEEHSAVLECRLTAVLFHSI